MSRVSPPNAAAVTVEKIARFPARALGGGRALWAFLPPGALSSGRRYPLLLAQDGQDLPRIRLKNILARLYAARQMEEIIVVGVQAGKDRMNEYGTAGALASGGLGAKAEAYTIFLLEEVLPFIAASYPIQTGPFSTGLMGWSLGGLAAFDIAWRHPDVFGIVGVFSGSLWWHTPARTPQGVQRNRILHRQVRRTRRPPRLRLWFEAGTLDETDDRDGNGVIDSIQDTTELMDELALKGYRPGVDMVYRQVEGGRHDLPTWKAVLPEFLAWAFPPGERDLSANLRQ